LQPIEFGKILKGGSEGETTLLPVREFSAKAGRQVVKDYVALPALISLSPAATYKSTLTANGVASVLRSIWANAVIFCGHFPMAPRNSRRPEVDPLRGGYSVWRVRRLRRVQRTAVGVRDGRYGSY
jgi:fatty acid desaturase